MKRGSFLILIFSIILCLIFINAEISHILEKPKVKQSNGTNIISFGIKDFSDVIEFGNTTLLRQNITKNSNKHNGLDKNLFDIFNETPKKDIYKTVTTPKSQSKDLKILSCSDSFGIKTDSSLSKKKKEQEIIFPTLEETYVSEFEKFPKNKTKLSLNTPKLISEAKIKKENIPKILKDLNKDSRFKESYDQAKSLGYTKINQSKRLEYDDGTTAILTTLISEEEEYIYLLSPDLNESTDFVPFLMKLERTNGTLILTIFNNKTGGSIDLMNKTIISVWGHGSCTYERCLVYGVEWALQDALLSFFCGGICGNYLSFPNPISGASCLGCLLGGGAGIALSCVGTGFGSYPKYCAYYPCQYDCDDADRTSNNWEYRCVGDDRYKKRLFHDYSCSSNNPIEGVCQNTNNYYIDDQFVESCSNGCEEPTSTTSRCKGEVTCYSDIECGQDGWLNSPYCSGGDVWQYYREYKCSNPGTESSYCAYSDGAERKQDCIGGTCDGGQCVGDAFCEAQDPDYPFYCNGVCAGSVDNENFDVCCPDSGNPQYACSKTGPFCETSTGECNVCGGNYPDSCNSQCWVTPPTGYELCCPDTGDPQYWCNSAASVCMGSGNCCVASTETCNNLDDNCDNIIDSFDEGCGVGICAGGTKTCSIGNWGVCSTSGNAITETCNNQDDDCDGSTDEEISQECGTDIGACIKGTQTCSVGQFGSCGGNYVGPINETCNGIDDNCNGVTDEDNICGDYPNVTLNSLQNNYVSNTGNITLNCSVTDDANLDNITLWHNFNGSTYLLPNETKTISGTNNSTVWIINNISIGNYQWNCRAFDNDSHWSWSENGPFSFTVTIPGLINTFADGSYEETLNYSQAENQTIDIKIPKDSNVTNATMMISGYNISVYNHTEVDYYWINWTALTTNFDLGVTTHEMYLTPDNPVSGLRMVYVGDSKYNGSFTLNDVPENVTLSIIHQTSLGSPSYSPVNITLNGNLVANCFSPGVGYTEDEWDITQYAQEGTNVLESIFCVNASTHYWIKWDDINSTYDKYIDVNPLDPSVFINVSLINTPKIWNYSGGYSTSKNITEFENELNDALNNCTADIEGYCNISLIVYSGSEGELKLSDIEIYYEIVDNSPNVTLVSPLDNNVSSTGNVTFVCDVNDDEGLFNVTLYTNINGSWQPNQTKIMTGISNSSNFTINNIQDNISFIWNCLAYDDEAQGDWANLNRTINISIPNMAPIVTNLTQFPISLYRGEDIEIRCTVQDNETINDSLNVSIQYQNTTNNAYIECENITYDSINNYWRCNYTTNYSDDDLGSFDFRCNVSDGELSSSWTIDTDSVTVSNNLPIIFSCQDDSILEDTDGSGIQVDLDNCSSDLEDSDSNLVYQINNQSNLSLINCYLNGHNITCNNPLQNGYGYSYIEVQVNDTDGGTNISFPLILISVNPVNDAPITTLNLPLSNSVSNTSIITFNCSATDDQALTNITLYGNWSGVWHANETKNVTGTFNSTIFTKTLDNGIYEWSCLTYDNQGLSNWANTNWTVNVNFLSIAIISPTSSEIFTQDTPTAIFNISTNVDSDTCYWNENGVNHTMNKESSTAFNITNISMVDGSHTISYWCNQSSDGAWGQSDLVSFNVDSVNVTVCRNLTVSRQYELVNNLSSSINCLDMQSDNIIFDGNNNNITITNSSAQYAIRTLGYDNLTIENINDIFMLSGNDFAILLSGSSNGRIDINKISRGRINLDAYFDERSDNNSININTIINSIAFEFDKASNNNISVLNLTASLNILMDIVGNSTNNIFNDSIFYGGDITIKSGSSFIFVNVSYDTTTETITGASNLTRKWYFSPQVNFSNGTAVESANITAYNSSGKVVFSLLTDLNGQISRKELMEYINNGGTKTYVTPHTIKISKEGYIINSTTYNLTIDKNVFHFVNLFPVLPPTINFIFPPTPTSGDMIFEFNDDFIINVNTSNADSVTVRLYDSSRVLINSTTSTSSNFVVNYSSLNLSSGVYFFNATAINSISETNSTHTRNIVYSNPFNFSDGIVTGSYKINVNESGFGNGNELGGDYFGVALASLGDLDGDGVIDIAVGEYRNDDGGTSNGAFWIMFMNRNGSVKSSYKINESRFGNGSELGGDYFGVSLANIGDLDGDGVVDLAVGEYSNDDGGTSNGAFWIMFMNRNGTVKSSYKINESRFGNGNELSGDYFGKSIANIGDLDGDGVTDLAVGEYSNDDGGTSNGAFWIMFMNNNGTVKSSYKINESRFGNGNELGGDNFGASLTNLGDLDGDGVTDLAVGEHGNDDGGASNGAFWIMFMNSNGSVKSSYKINESRFGNGNELDGDLFGFSLTSLGDLDGDGVTDLAVGEHGNDDGDLSNGAFWVMFMNSNGSVKSSYEINEARFGNGDELSGDSFGIALAALGDLDGDGVIDLAVGEYRSDDGGSQNGAFWIMNFERPIIFNISILYPTGNISVSQNVFFNVSVNITCIQGDCGTINVTLDPERVGDDGELLDRRTYNQKVFTMERWRERYQIHTGQIHYKDKNNGDEFANIDTRLVSSASGWVMDKASYSVNIPEYSDGRFTFTNEYEEARGDVVGMTPDVVNRVKGVLSGNNSVVYKDAFGTNIDLKVIARRNGFDKLVVLNEKPTDLSNDLEFEFELDLKEFDITTDGAEWNKANKVTVRSDIVLRGHGDTIFREFRMWDSDGNSVPIDVRLEKRRGKFYFVKILDKEFLERAVYPVQTDDTETYYFGNGDGYVYNSDTTWSNARSAASGLGYDYTGTIGYTYNFADSIMSSYQIYRSFIPIDTSGIAENVAIDSATLNLYGYNKYDDFSLDFHVVQTTQASTSSLTISDFSAVGSTSGGSMLMSSFMVNAWNVVTLDSTGIGWIDTTGWTTLGLRDYQDLYDFSQGDGTSDIEWYTSEDMNAPYLELETTITAKGIIPVNSGNPFYTNNSNPRMTASLNEGESEVIRYWVNPTGTAAHSYTFFVLANKTDYLSNGVMSNMWNVSIV